MSAEATFPPLPDVPLVSVFSTTYNHERFIGPCIESVLSQGWPADRLQFVLVDDGSTDHTPDVIAPYADQLTLIRQENQGLRAAVNRSISQVVGDVVLPVSGDDMLASGRIEAAVEFLRAHPDIGWCYGEVEVIDDDNQLLSTSLAELHHLPLYEGQVTGKLVIDNFITGGALTFRGCLKSAIYPIPDYAGWEDWWWAYRLSLTSRNRRLPAVVYRYRQHATNLSLGVSGAGLARLRVEEQRFRLWMLVNTPRDKLPLEDAFATVEKFLSLQRLIVDDLPNEPVLSAASEFDAARAENFALGVDRLLGCGNSEAAAWLAIRAFGLNPVGARGLSSVRAAESAYWEPEAERRRELRAQLGARRFVVAAKLTTLAAAPALLSEFGEVFDSDSDCSLWVLTPSAALDAGTELQELLARIWPDESHWPDVHLHTDLSDAAITQLTLSADHELVMDRGDGRKPADELRELATLVWTAYATDVPLA